MMKAKLRRFGPPATAQEARQRVKRRSLRALNFYQRCVELEQAGYCGKEKVAMAENKLKGLGLLIQAYGVLTGGDPLKDKGPQ